MRLIGVLVVLEAKVTGIKRRLDFLLLRLRGGLLILLLVVAAVEAVVAVRVQVLVDH